MKRYIYIFTVIILATLVFGSCQYSDDDVKYPYTSIYLPNQQYNRNIVVGEGLELKVGVIFSGVVNNNQERSVSYTIDPTLVNTEGQLVLPEKYYTFDNKAEIKVAKGELKGYITIKMDSVAFLNDPKAITGEYILPIKLTTPNNVDRISEGKDYLKLSISYFAKQHGNYTYKGKSIQQDGTEKTYQNNPTITNSFRFLKTAAYNQMRVIADPEGANDPAKNAYSFIVEVPTFGKEVKILTDPLSPVALLDEKNPSISDKQYAVVLPEGESSYDAENKIFTLNYSYTIFVSDKDDNVKSSTTYKVSEELTFRNRIRDVQADGLYINEWRGF